MPTTGFCFTNLTNFVFISGNNYLVFYSDASNQGVAPPVSLGYSYHARLITDVGKYGPGVVSTQYKMAKDEIRFEELDETIIPEKSINDGKIIKLAASLFISVYSQIVFPTTGNGVIMAAQNIGSSTAEFYLTGVAPKSGFESEVTIAVTEAADVNIYDNENNLLVNQNLNKDQVYNFRISNDVTGYKVSSNVPAAVIAGTTCADLGTDCHMIKSYLPSKDRLGQKHIVPQIPARSSASAPSTIRVVATEPGTAVRTFDSTVNGVVERSTISAGQFYDHSMTDNKPTVIECSKKCLVSLLVQPFTPTAPYPIGTGTVRIF